MFQVPSSVFLFLGFILGAVQSLGLSSCENNPLIRINRLDLSPGDVHPGGEITVTADWDILGDIRKPVKAEFQLFKTMGFLRVGLPCTKNIGSCTYANICRLTPGPMCDFSKGHHSISGAKFKVPAAKNMAGTYDMEVRLTDGAGRRIGCWNGKVSVR